MVLFAVDQLQTEVLEIRLVDPRVNDSCVHVLVLLVLVIELLVSLLALDVNAVQMPFLHLTGQVLERRACIVLNDRLGEPERLGLAAVAAHGKLEVGNSLLGPLELDN